MFRVSLFSLFTGLTLLSLFAGLAAPRAQTAAAPNPAQNSELRIALIGPDAGLVSRDIEGKFAGVLIDVADALAAHIGRVAKPVLYDNRTRFNVSLGKDEWEVALVPRDLSRTEQQAFTEPFMEIDYGYLARAGTSLKAAQDVDRPGVRVAVAQGSPADGFLTRTLKRAEIVRLFGGSSTLEARQALGFGRAEVYADSTHVISRIAREIFDATVLVGRFSTVPMVVAVPKKNADTVLPTMNEFVQEAKRKQVVAEAIKRAGLAGVRAAR
jgi:polar amino acid transport system substrate-binding protein